MSGDGREVQQTYLPRGRRGAYKLLISETAGELSEENLKRIVWLAEVPARHRSKHALEVLEYLQNVGYFSETNVQPLSDLLKNAGRADLTGSVDNYTAQHSHHSSLPSTPHPPPPLTPAIPHSCSYSEVSHTHSMLLPSPHQETRPLKASQAFVYPTVGGGASTHPLEASQEHLSPASHPGGGAAQVPRPSSAVPVHGGNPHAMQGHFNWVLPNQSTSLEGLPHAFQWGKASQPLAPGSGSLTSPGSYPQPQRSWVDSRSLSNSGTSQDAFSLYSEPVSIPRSNHSSRIRPEHFRMATSTQTFYPSGGGPRPAMPHHGQPYPVSNWYQASYPSASSIPDAGSMSFLAESHPPLFDPRQAHGHYQYHPHHNSTSEISPLSSSQESYVNIPHAHGRYSLPGYHYSPLHPRRTPSFTRNHSPLRHQSISEYPDPSGEELSLEDGVTLEASSEAAAATAAALGEASNKHVAQSKTSNGDGVSPNKSGVGSVGALNDKQLRVEKRGELSKAAGSDRPPFDKNACKKPVPKLIAEEVVVNISNNQSSDPITTSCADAAVSNGIPFRRRANSAKLNNRLSLQLAAADEKSRRRYSSASGGGTGGGAGGGATGGNLADSRASHISCSRASTMLSTSTLNSEDSHFSPQNSLTKCRPTVTAATATATASTTTTSSTSQKSAPHTQKKKETLISRLKGVVRHEDQLKWSIKREKLQKIIYKQQRDKHLTCSSKVELEAGPGTPKPKLVLCLHPYGLEEDANTSVTLEVRIETSARSKPLVQQLDSRAEVEVSVRAEDREGVELGRRCVTQSARFNYFLVRGFINHQLLKQSHSETVVVTCSAKLVYISAV